jgi:hypothetical protein
MTRYRTDLFIAIAGVAVFLALVLPCNAAFAQDPTVLTDEQALTYSLPIARQAFNQPYCGDRVRVELRADGKLDDLAAFWNAHGNPTPGYAGYAFSDAADASWPVPHAQPCTIYLRSLASHDLTREGFCEVLAHEFGHVAGWSHQADDPLMNATGLLEYAPCAAGLPGQPRPAFARALTEQRLQPERTTYREMVHDFNETLPKMGAPWAARCKGLRGRPGQLVCYLSNPRAKHVRRYVVRRMPYDWQRAELPKRGAR